MSLTDVDLSAACSPRAFELHRAACEWQIDRPILVRGEDDILSREQITVPPYAHQVKNLLTFCRLAPVALLADDVGLGKTISAGLILAELVVRKKVRKALVICPRVLVTQWERELTDKFRLPVVTATGKQIREAVGVNRGVIVTTYETVRDHLDAISDAGIQMLILDEAHRLRRLHGSDDPPLLATRIRQVLEQRRFKFVLLLMATPIQNRIWDLYSLIDCLTVAKGHRHPLGVPDQFAKKYIKGSRQKALEVYPHRLREFRGHVRRYIARTRRSEAGLLFPKREVRLHLVKASRAELALGRMLGRHFDKLDRLSQINLAQALMSSPHALKAQLTNMVGKAPHLGECLKGACPALHA
jgi:SNF2 family DNA or RNA helicase